MYNVAAHRSPTAALCAGKRAVVYAAPTDDAVGKPKAPKLWQLQRPPVISCRRITAVWYHNGTVRKYRRLVIAQLLFSFRVSFPVPPVRSPPPRLMCRVFKLLTPPGRRAQHPKIERFRRSSTAAAAADGYRARPFPLPHRNNNNNNNNSHTVIIDNNIIIMYGFCRHNNSRLLDARLSGGRGEMYYCDHRRRSRFRRGRSIPLLLPLPHVEYPPRQFPSHIVAVIL